MEPVYNCRTCGAEVEGGQCQSCAWANEGNAVMSAVEAERERIIGILNRPSKILTAALHFTANEEAWLGEAFLANYLAPKP